jgi:hypothetical protein
LWDFLALGEKLAALKTSDCAAGMGVEPVVNIFLRVIVFFG